MSFLSLQNVNKQFGGLTAVNSLTATIGKGEIVGLLGPNGSGKTTLLNLLSGALPLSSGEISLEGVKLSGKRADQIARRGIARTFQLVRVLPSLNLIENVMISAVFGPAQHDLETSRQAAMTALARVDLDGKANKAAGDLTYIDQKRLELARALAAEPKLLLLDEWLAGLNPTELQDGVTLIHSLLETGTTILMVEHIMTAVRALCPRCLVMNSGSLIADGPTKDVLADKSVMAAYLGEMADA